MKGGRIEEGRKSNVLATTPHKNIVLSYLNSVVYARSPIQIQTRNKINNQQ
jgi:hypothetical protein